MKPRCPAKSPRSSSRSTACSSCCGPRCNPSSNSSPIPLTNCAPRSPACRRSWICSPQSPRRRPSKIAWPTLQEGIRQLAHSANQLLTLARADPAVNIAAKNQTVGARRHRRGGRRQVLRSRLAIEHRSGSRGAAGSDSCRPLAARRPAEQSRRQRAQIHARGRYGDRERRRTRRQALSSRWRIPVRAFRRMSASECASASIGCPIHPAMAAAWGWRSSRRSHSCTRPHADRAGTQRRRYPKYLWNSRRASARLTGRADRPAA